MASSALPPPRNTRLVTVVAHVDHGKTTLADNLIESNGIISERLAGTLRYLDSNEEEQRRGITMKASAIALRHSYFPSPASRSATGDRTKGTEDVVIHLVDSPGHVDFASEVTSSLLACDGALVLVDAVEGVCARTHAVLREAHANQLVPVLVINKIDRLCTHLHLSPTEAYVRIRELVESINAASASMITAAALVAVDEAESLRQASASGNRSGMNLLTSGGAATSGADDESSVWNFDPSRGNVIFSSGLHGWGFSVPSLCRSLFRAKLIPLKPAQLRQVLFGDYRYNGQTQKILKWKQHEASGGGDEAREPMFAEFGLRPLWRIYEGVSIAAASTGISSNVHQADGQNKKASNCFGVVDQQKKIGVNTPGMEQVFEAMQHCHTLNGATALVPSTREEMNIILKKVSASSEEAVLRALLRRFRSLSDTVLDAVCEVCPSPMAATSIMRTKTLALKEPDFPHINFRGIQQAVKACAVGPGMPTVAHVCKFMPVKRCEISDPELQTVCGDDDADTSDKLMALVRVLSGSLTARDDVEYEVYGPKHNPSVGENNNVPKRRVKVYLIMGASIVRVDSIPAGHICAVSDLDDLQLKTMTLCSREGGMPLQGFDTLNRPLVKVNVEPVKACDSATLEKGLLKLSLADSAVEVTATSRGECILACQGELHLQQCILDLKQVFCEKPIDMRISDPIVDFGESTDWFEKETDFNQFWNSKMKPLRQVTLPLYCEEEGLGNARLGRCRALLSGRGAALSLRVVPLPRSVYECLREKKLVEGSKGDLELLAKSIGITFDEEKAHQCHANISRALCNSACFVDSNGNCLVESSGVASGDCVKAVLSDFGEVYIPSSTSERGGVGFEFVNEVVESESESEEGSVVAGKRVGREEYDSLLELILHGRDSPFSVQGSQTKADSTSDGRAPEKALADSVARSIWISEMRGSAVAGFQLAMRAGPFCEEPVRGVMVILEGIEIAMTKRGVRGPARTPPTPSFVPAKPISGGMVVSALRQGIRCALLTRPARIVEGYVRLTFHSSLSGLGPLYAVLSKRRGRVVSDEMVEGTDLLLITAVLPQSESFGLFQELLDKSSGEISAPEFVFSHFEMLREDPFWIPTSEEEREDFGEIVTNGDLSTGVTNNALAIIRDVRKRKGLLVDSAKIVVAAEKQRTLARKK